MLGLRTARGSVCQLLDETEGAKPGIKIMGIIYRTEWASQTQAWNVSERKCIIDQSLLGDVILFSAKRRAGGLGENNTPYQKLHACCVSELACSSTYAELPLRLHR